LKRWVRRNYNSPGSSEPPACYEGLKVLGRWVMVSLTHVGN